jgi:hypothetical protein
MLAQTPIFANSNRGALQLAQLPEGQRVALLPNPPENGRRRIRLESPITPAEGEPVREGWVDQDRLIESRFPRVQGDISADAIRVYLENRRGRGNRRMTDEQINQVATGLARAASDAGVSVLSIASLCLAESGGFPGIRNRTSSATGLCQIIRGTWNGPNGVGTRPAGWATRYMVPPAFPAPVPHNPGASDPYLNAFLTASNFRDQLQAVNRRCGVPPNSQQAQNIAYLVHYRGSINCSIALNSRPDGAQPTHSQWLGRIRGVQESLLSAHTRSLARAGGTP